MAYQDVGYGSDENWDLSYFPPREENAIYTKTFRKLPTNLDKIYRETVQAFNGGLTLLCAVGLRALLEGICDRRGITGRSLEAKIDGLKGILRTNIVTNLHSFRFIGNKAIHELTPPETHVLRLAIEVVEDLLNFPYEFDYKASGLTRYKGSGSIYPPAPVPEIR